MSEATNKELEALYGQMLEAGYSAPGLAAASDTTQYGGQLSMPLYEGHAPAGAVEQVGKAEGRIDPVVATSQVVPHLVGKEHRHEARKQGDQCVRAGNDYRGTCE